MDFILGIMPFQLVEILGAVLQLLRSALIVFGIVSLVNGITAEVTRDQTYRLSETLLRIEERVRELNIRRAQRTIFVNFEEQLLGMKVFSVRHAVDHKKEKEWEILKYSCVCFLYGGQFGRRLGVDSYHSCFGRASIVGSK